MTLAAEVISLRSKTAPKNLIKRLVTRFSSGYITQSLKSVTGIRNIILELRGSELASYTDWNGKNILRMCSVALEDANFHKESSQIDDMIKLLEIK